MNLAIIIGVSEYTDTINNLPGCKNDLAAINNIITKSEKYGHILLLDKNQPSSIVKNELINFIEEYKEQKINEVFFYYTGHGEFINNEFHYQLTDYNPQKRKQTSLQNLEIDNLLKTLNPALVVKVIDACQSGTSYIKDNSAVTKHFDESKHKFSKCYFLSSSLSNQSSFQNEDMSFFTKSFVDAIKESKTDDVRYKAIMDYISDAFESIGNQTPYFVIQAEYTEKFCTKNSGLKSYLNSLDARPSENQGEKAISLFDLVVHDSKSYISKEEALTLVDIIKQESSKAKLISEIASLYNLEMNIIDEYSKIPGRASVGLWLDSNVNTYFAKVIRKRVLNKVPQEIVRLRIHEKEDTSKATYEIDGYELKVDVPFKGISFDANSKYPNISSYNLSISFLLSKKSIRVFFFTHEYNEESWDNRKLILKPIDARTLEHNGPNPEKLKLSIKNIIKSFNDRIAKDLQEKFKQASEQEGKSQESK